ncbi:MAG: hypothetical protein ACP5NE_00545 [Candidatus Micrarchaeia archaeon]
MEENLSYEILWQASYKEKKTNELQTLPKTFYEDINAYLISLKGDEELETKRNAQKLLSELIEKRKQKILIYIAYNKPLPQPSIEIEQEFYEKVSTIFKAEVFDKTAAKHAKEETLNVVKDIPELLLPSGKRIGPLKKGDLLPVVDKEDAEFLKAAAICSN